MMSKESVLLILPVCAALLTGCGADYGKVCTTSFALTTVVAVDGQGAPVSGMTVTDSVLRTHERFVVNQISGPYPAGTVTVFDDSQINRIRESGDPVRVTGTNGTLAFSADFTFAARGGCHVEKLAGPDTVVAR